MTEDEELLRNPGDEVRLEVIHSAAADGAVLGLCRHGVCEEALRVTWRAQALINAVFSP